MAEGFTLEARGKPKKWWARVTLDDGTRPRVPLGRAAEGPDSMPREAARAMAERLVEIGRRDGNLAALVERARERAGLGAAAVAARRVASARREARAEAKAGRRRIVAPRCSGIYFIESRSEQVIKIGFATNIHERVRDHQTSNPSPLLFLGFVPGDRREERALHLRFAADRVRGEWFAPSHELRSFIRAFASVEQNEAMPAARAEGEAS